MEALIARRKRERHLAINQPLNLRVSKPFAANLQIKSLVHGATPSEVVRMLMDLGCQQLGWDMEGPS
jgi:hypothetical protein